MTHHLYRQLAYRSARNRYYRRDSSGRSYAGDKSIFLTEATAAFLSHLQASGYAASTVVCYRDCLHRLTNILGEVIVCKVRTEDIENALASFKQTCSLSEVTLNKIRSAYRSMFRWLFETGKITNNPADRLTLARAVSLPALPITMDEVSALLDTVRGSGKANSRRDELLFAMYAFTGVRRSEALRLRVGDYDDRAREIQIIGGKGGVSRRLPVAELLAEPLDLYLGQKTENNFIFTGGRAQHQLSTRQAENRFDFWKHLSGIRNKLTIHSFRAGFATRLYRATGDIWLVARSLGHKSIATTRRYIETDSTDIRRAIEIAFTSNSLTLLR